MLSPETVAEYRRMTPGQRLEFSVAIPDRRSTWTSWWRFRANG
jgi:hypothetical protein